MFHLLLLLLAGLGGSPASGPGKAGPPLCPSQAQEGLCRVEGSPWASDGAVSPGRALGRGQMATGERGTLGVCVLGLLEMSL